MTHLFSLRQRTITYMVFLCWQPCAADISSASEDDRSIKVYSFHHVGGFSYHISSDSNLDL